MTITEPRLQELIDREAIRDCLFCYCRGIDRADESVLRSAYWPDGTDTHGTYRGSVAGFIEWALATLKTVELVIHQLHNILIEFGPGGAAVETYFTAIQRQPGEGGTMVQRHMAGRYLDWFEPRGGEWRIRDRVVVFDWIGEMPLPTPSETARAARRDPMPVTGPGDPLYALLARLGE